MAGPAGIAPPPLVVQYDPLGRALTEEQKQRLREELAPPLQQSEARQRSRDRRREDADGRPDATSRHPPDHLIDQYV